MKKGSGITNIILTYAVFSAAWILFSDRLLNQLIANPRLNLSLQTYKGWVFVAATAVLGFFALRQWEKRLKASQLELNLIADNMVDLVARVDRDGRFLWVSPSYEKVLGYRPKDLVGTVAVDRIHPDERATIGALFNKLLDGKTGPAVFRFRDSLGAYRWLEVSGKRLFDSRGTTTGSIFGSRDITERKLAEEARRASEELYKAIVETTDTGYVIIDTGGRVIDCNGKYVRLTGRDDMDEVKGRSVVEWTAEYEKEKNARAVRECVEKGFIRNLELDYRGPDGSITPVEISATVTIKDGRPIVLSLVRDISERRKAEEQNRKLETRLIQAQKMDAIGTLAGGIAHDFNNMMSGVFGYVDLARIDLKTGNTSDADGNLARVLEVLERAKSLANQLLTFSKGGAPVKKIVPVLPVIERAVSFSLSGSQVTASFALPADLWQCDIDENQISQVIDNIVINARQAMRSGGSIAISGANIGSADAPTGLAEGDYIRICVRDTGAGIDPADMPRIFEPFFTTKQTGSGLGLAMSYSIVTKHGGRITI